MPTILEIDLQGARRVKERAKELGLDVVYVFIAPPSFDELKKRLIGRGTETPEQQAKRLETAKVELAAEPEFDVTIVNEQVDKAARTRGMSSHRNTACHRIPTDGMRHRMRVGVPPRKSVAPHSHRF